MKKQNSFLIIQKIFLLLFLLGQLWVSTLNYCYWMVDSNKEFVELTNSEENETEEETEKQDKEDKNRVNISNLKSVLTYLELNNYNSTNITSLHHPEITTPPPKIIFF